MMSVLPAALGEAARLRRVVRRVEHFAGRAVAGHAVAAQIGKMRCERRGPRAMPDDARLDHDHARAGGETTQRAEASGATAPKVAAALSAGGSSMQPAGLLRRSENTGDEALASSRLLRADAARSDVEFVVSGHGRQATR